MNRTTLILALLATVGSAEAVDDVCDGYGSPEASTRISQADNHVDGTKAYAYSGRAVDYIGDFDGDGREDVAIGAPGDSSNGFKAGAVDLYLSGGEPVRVNGSPAMRIYGPGAYTGAGWVLSGVGDTNGDGLDDLLIGANPVAGSPYRKGVAWVVLGRAQPQPHLNLAINADATLEGSWRRDGFGQSVVGLGDTNGDGFDDFAIGAPYADPQGFSSGATYVFHGPLLGAHVANEAFAVFPGETMGDRSGYAVAPAGDVDGDGSNDLLIGAPGWGLTRVQDGAVYVVSGSDLTAGVHPLSAASQRLRGSGGERFGWSLSTAGDVNDDGSGDFWVGARQASRGKRGSLYLFHGAPIGGGDVLVSQSWEARINGAAVLDYLGHSVAGGQDLDNDGELDVVVGAITSAGAVPRAGAAIVVTGPFTGQFTVSKTRGRFGGDTASAQTGFSVAVAPDLNGDGFDEWLIGSPGTNAGGRLRAGAVGMYFGGHDESDLLTWHRDADFDTWGSDLITAQSCEPIPGFVLRGGDCDDTPGSGVAFHPFVRETNCDDPRDLNCDGSTGHDDRDLDGYQACMGDCADNRATVNPGRDEVCFNDLDDNCDEAVDDANAVDATNWYPDGDHDGYGNQDIVFRSCEIPTFFLEPPITRGEDCDDQDVTVHPDVAELCDDADNDCDGDVDDDAIDATDYFRDADADGSGQLLSRVRTCDRPTGYVDNYRDCDDTQEALRPGRPEVCNFLDDDCDGQFYRGGHLPQENATWRVDGLVQGYKFGRALTSVPDTDGDGDDELAVSATGDVRGAAVYVGRFDLVSGAYDWTKDFGGGITAWSLRVSTSSNQDGFGASIVGGDFDGDGIGDLAIGSPTANSQGIQDSGAVYVYYGPFNGRDTTPALADAKIYGSHGGDRVGEKIVAGDLDGDGDDDLMIAAIGLDDNLVVVNPDGTVGPAVKRGGVYVLNGAADRATWQTVTLDTEPRVLGLAARDELGRSLAFLGDTDGNGRGEFIIGAPRAGADRHGYAMVVEPAIGVNAGLLTPLAVIHDDRGNSQLGYQVDGGDIDGDGSLDLVIASAQSDVYIYHGAGEAWTGGLISTLPITLFDGPIDQELGNSMDVADVNGDGRDDVVTGAPEDDEGGFHAGAVYILYGHPELPDFVQLDDVESFGRVLPGTIGPVFSYINNCYYEGAKMIGQGSYADFGYAVLAGFQSGVVPQGDVIGSAPGANRNTGSIAAWATGPYGTDWREEENPELIASKQMWWPDLNLDGRPDIEGPAAYSCTMHIPDPCNNPDTLPGCRVEDDGDGDGLPDCFDTEICDGLDNDGDHVIDESFDTDGDGVSNCVDTEECDGVDNDGDGLVDEGFDVDGDGTANCFDSEVCDHVDNDGDGEIDENFDNDGDHVSNCFDPELCDGIDNDGDEVVDEGYDVDVNGVADCFEAEICDGQDNDGDGFVDEGFDADHDGTVDCQDTEVCDGQDNDGDGATDEGFDADRDGVANCFDTEVCDGQDNDGDASVDEGLDADHDNVPDCFDTEVCDGQDNDGDGATDEGFDADSDGVANCFDAETCDGVDNDADGAVDEGFDVDVDGVANCFDTEACDGVDNDGDAAIDEGFDADGDGLANCFDTEACDGLDNDGDAAIDEGFDADGDGVANCFDTETCDGLDNDGDGSLDEGFDADSDGVANCFDPEVCDGLDNDGDAAVDEGFDADADGLANCYDTEACDGLDNDGDGAVDEGFDSDHDGTADCADVEACDGLDNDGDALIDEGFDTDHDGIADCADIEVCDGSDNNGNGQVDEGFDNDSDGLANCFDAETCDGIDNDGNGSVDEGYDNDADGTANCFDTEVCDAFDNDGDGVTNEGFDADHDGLADCFDAEVCDGQDNDGDGATDEGFDSDADGTANCFDAEVCDGQDNDGDSAVDEGFDNDHDGVANCFDTEVCDGSDNDGDGSTDEGFDVDHDGLADCYDAETCDGLDNDGDGSTDEGFDNDSDGIANCYDTETCDAFDNDGDGVNNEGFDSDGDGLANCFDAETCDGLDNDGDGATDEGFDNDHDGLANCYDTETCDGVDNDGDATTDEGFDNDTDGVANCFDVETCDAVDNDGDGVNNEGFDADGDGVANCFDTETCDAVDNDGDGSIDEGFDSDHDGVADCFDVEICDGLDNDGDTQIDEGMDSDRDGLANCFDTEVCDGQDNDGDAATDEGFDVDQDGVANCFDPETCDGQDNDGDAIVDEGFDFDGDGLANCFDTETCDSLDNDGDGLVDEGFDSDSDGLANCYDTETCDGLDNDGDGLIDEGMADADNDGVCNGLDVEACDGVDNDGDGLSDEGGVCPDVHGLCPTQRVRTFLTYPEGMALGWLSYTTNSSNAAIMVIRNGGSLPVVITEQLLVTSTQSQSHILDEGNLGAIIPAGGSRSVYYGSYTTPNGVVETYLNQPAWWCVELQRPTSTGSVYNAFGEKAPSVLTSLITPGLDSRDTWGGGNGVQANYDLWNYLAGHRVLTVGKMTAKNAGQGTVTVTLRARDMGSGSMRPVAPNGTLTDTIPSGWHGVGLSGWTSTANADGTTTISRPTTLNPGGVGRLGSPTTFTYQIAPNQPADADRVDFLSATITYVDAGVTRTQASQLATVFSLDGDHNGYVECP